MNYFDLLNIIIISVCGIVGFYRGFIKEISGLILILCAIVVSIYFAPPVKYCLDQYVPLPTVNTVLAYVIVFFFTILLSKAFFIFHFLAKIKFLSAGLDGLLGGLFGLTKGVVICLVIFAAMSLLQLDSKIIIVRDAYSSAMLERLSNAAFKVAYHYSVETKEEDMPTPSGQNSHAAPVDTVEAGNISEIKGKKSIHEIIKGEDLTPEEKMITVQKMVADISARIEEVNGVIPPEKAEVMIKIVKKFSTGLIREIYNQCCNQEDDNKNNSTPNQSSNQTAAERQNNMLLLLLNTYKNYKNREIKLNDREKNFILEELPKYLFANQTPRNEDVNNPDNVKQPGHISPPSPPFVKNSNDASGNQKNDTTTPSLEIEKNKVNIDRAPFPITAENYAKKMLAPEETGLDTSFSESNVVVPNINYEVPVPLPKEILRRGAFPQRAEPKIQEQQTTSLNSPDKKEKINNLNSKKTSKEVDELNEMLDAFV